MIAERELQIAEIIRKRQPFLEDIERKQQGLRRRAEAIQDIEKLYTRIEQRGLDSMVALLKDVKGSLSALQTKIDDTVKKLEKPKSRFSRHTLNIGVIGKAGQGKSTLLQSLSGVGPEVIPTGNKSHCTGTRSLIVHDPNQPTHGEISFYSEPNFRSEVLHPYYDMLDLGPVPTLDEFERNTPPPLQNDLKNNTLAGDRYRHLLEYRTNLSYYRPDLGQSLPFVEKSKIREYIAQDNEAGEKVYHHYMAVREARIICDFGYPDVGQIALVDMPGLGDTSVGDEKRLTDALSEHLDIVLFVLMPNPHRAFLGEPDFYLYDLTQNALNGIRIDQWSYMILNHKYSQDPKDDNEDNCFLIKKDIDDGKVGIKGNRISVLKTMVVDCHDDQAVKNDILDTVVEYLAQNMSRLDEMYMFSWQKIYDDLISEIDTTLERARLTLDIEQSKFREKQDFNRQFNALWGELTTASQELIRQLEQERNKPDTAISRYLNQVFQKCRQDKGLPTLKEIQDKTSEEKTEIYAFYHFLNLIRTHLTHHFSDIDQHMEDSMNDVKARVAEMFLETGHLSNMMNGNGAVGFFPAMIAQKTLTDEVQTTFRTFYEYKLSMRGLLQHYIRLPKNLDCVTPRTAPLPERATADMVLKSLTTLQARAVNNIEEELKQFKYVPSDAALAMVGEFIDQIFYSQGAEDAWRTFYDTQKERVWPEIFEQNALWADFQRDWQICVQQAININRADRPQTSE